MKKTAILAGFSLLLASSLAGPASAADQIRILFPTWPGFAPVFVAKDLGYFGAEGLDVDVKFEDDRSNVMAAMARGDIEMNMRTVGEYQGRPRDASTPGVIIGTIDRSLGGDGVIVDGSIKSVADLKGKTVAAEPNVPAWLLLQLALKENGLTLKDIETKNIVTPDTVAVFADSSISAVATYEPFMSQAVKTITQRDPKILISSKDTDIIDDVISVRQDDLKANPDKYVKFLKALYKAVDYYKTNPDDFIKLSAPHFNLSEAEVKEILDTSLTYTGFKESLEYIGTPGKPGTLYGIFDTVMQLNIDSGAADKALVAADQIDPSVMGKLAEQMK
ncbi:putative aliphatic sulfonates-binding protein precursor [Hartmannibacter diazotrophicus]|uniref:Putative aliphatic sulfonates-binding protein n=1 Tax=Hartmannibacter diazotrophicus TaxID=1482074 RepID=A0A2C9D9G1_9HYPH|nr:ABC transporter substrate-binding protein [Hartmannibacter diazotrophicus]SON56829.1 putative aliphatic sulfonates-binding protein precursor [Hartmannibacter diazotrophicus]